MPRGSMALELASRKGVINYHTPEFVDTSIYINGRGDKRIQENSPFKCNYPNFRADI